MKRTLFFLCLAALLLACGGDKTKTNESTEPATESAQQVEGPNGQRIFKQNCVVCHGIDGKLGANGSKDLTQSVLQLDERISIITNGKNVMIPFNAILTAEEIEAVANFTMTLK